MGLEEQIKRAVNTGKATVGLKSTEKAVLFGKAKYVFFSSDLVDLDKERLIYLLKLAKIPYKELNYTYKELGEMIGKDFPVSAIGIEDEGKAKIELKAE